MNRRVAGALRLLCAVLVVPVAAQQTKGDVNPKKAIVQARAAVQAGRLPEALSVYDAILASPVRDAAKYKAEALYGATILRLSPDKSVADPDRARAALNELTTTTPSVEHRQELAVLLHLLQQLDNAARRAEEEQRAREQAAVARGAEVADYQKRLEDLAGRLAAVRAETVGGKADADKLRQDVSALRAETRNLRDQLAKTQAELEKKDAALRKVAGSLVNSQR